MHTLHSGGSFPNSQSFQIPLRIVTLAGLSVSGEREPEPNLSVLIIVTGGSGMIEVDGQPHSLSSGSLLCSTSGQHISLSPQYSLQGIWIEYSAFNPQLADDSPFESSMLVDECSLKACTLAAQLLKIWNEPAAVYNPFSVQMLFAELLAELYANKSERPQPPVHWLERVLQYIEANYNEDLTRGQMAELAQVSPEHFSRTFRKATGQTFNEFLTLQRIRRVQQRMLTGTPNLSTLAMEVGYSEGTYLSRKFKQVVGISPAAFHRKNKRIVTLNFNHTASLRALEIVPELGVYSGWMEQLDLVPAYPEFKVENGNDAALYHSVAAAKPDVIISYALSAERKQLLPVAPVIELPYMQMGWREQFRIIAEIADRKQQAESWLLRYDELCHNANQELDRLIGPRGTAVVWEVGEEAAYCYSSSFGHGCQILYGDLGFHPPAALLEQGLLDRGYLETSIEDIAAYSADHIFITSSPSSPEGQERLHTMLHSPRWQALAAVRRGSVFQLDQPEKFYGFDPLSTLAQLKTFMHTIRSQIYMRQDHIKP